MDSHEELWSTNATCTPISTSHCLRTALRGRSNFLGSSGRRGLPLVKDNSQGKAAALRSWGWVQRDLSRAPPAPTSQSLHEQGPGAGFCLSVSMRAPLEFDDELPSLSRLSPGKSPAYGPCIWKMAGYKDRSPENADARDCIIAPEGHSKP